MLMKLVGGTSELKWVYQYKENYWKFRKCLFCFGTYLKDDQKYLIRIFTIFYRLFWIELLKTCSIAISSEIFDVCSYGEYRLIISEKEVDQNILIILGLKLDEVLESGDMTCIWLASKWKPQDKKLPVLKNKQHCSVPMTTWKLI